MVIIRHDMTTIMFTPFNDHFYCLMPFLQFQGWPALFSLIVNVKLNSNVCELSVSGPDADN